MGKVKQYAKCRACGVRHRPKLACIGVSLNVTLEQAAGLACGYELDERVEKRLRIGARRQLVRRGFIFRGKDAE